MREFVKTKTCIFTNLVSSICVPYQGLWVGLGASLLVTGSVDTTFVGPEWGGEWKQHVKADVLPKEKFANTYLDVYVPSSFT